MKDKENKTIPFHLSNEGSWTEDYEGEIGGYINVCKKCDVRFLGHKYRRICKVCDK